MTISFLDKLMRTISIFGLVIGIVSASKVAAEPATAAGAAAGAVSHIDLAFVTHLDMEMAEQDVFIERRQGSGDVYRVTIGDNDMQAPLFKAARPVRHNPVDPGAVGPYPKGEPLNMTLGEWLKHRGIGKYSCINGTGRLDTSFTGLVPDGLYTMWHAFMPAAVTEPFAGTLDLPLGAGDGSESVFRANGEGDATFVHEFKPCLQMSDAWTVAMIAINWHSDDEAYGADPGEGDGADASLWRETGRSAKVEDYGRGRVTVRAEDNFKFRTPALRNVELTRPWGHDGAYDSLEDVVRHHVAPLSALEDFRLEASALPPLNSALELTASGARLQKVLPSDVRMGAFGRQDGWVQQRADLRMPIARANELEPVDLNDREIAAPMAFLHSLTDPSAMEMAALIPDRVPSNLPVDR